MFVRSSKMCRLKSSVKEMKIIRVVKSQAVILNTGVLNIRVFSNMVGYLEGGIYCEEEMSPFFLKWYTVVIALIHDAQRACSCQSTVQ